MNSIHPLYSPVSLLQRPCHELLPFPGLSQRQTETVAQESRPAVSDFHHLRRCTAGTPHHTTPRYPSCLRGYLTPKTKKDNAENSADSGPSAGSLPTQVSTSLDTYTRQKTSATGPPACIHAYRTNVWRMDPQLEQHIAICIIAFARQPQPNNQPRYARQQRGVVQRLDGRRTARRGPCHTHHPSHHAAPQYVQHKHSLVLASSRPRISRTTLHSRYVRIRNDRRGGGSADSGTYTTDDS